MKYKALMGFKDAATGAWVEKDGPYPPNSIIVGEDWIQYLLGSSNRVGRPVIEVVEEDPKPIVGYSEIEEPQPIKNPFELPTITEPEPLPATPMLPFIEPETAHKTVDPEPASMASTKPSPEQPSEFEGLSETGLQDAFRILAAGTGYDAPDTRAEMLRFLHSDVWTGENIEEKRALLKLFRVRGAPKMKAAEVDTHIEDVLKRAIAEIMGV